MESPDTSQKPPLPPQEPKQDPLKSAAKREQVLVACAICRQKKTKCDAVRPSCGPCLLQNRTCYYEVEPGTTRNVSLKRRFDAAQADLSQLQQIYEAIRNSSPAEATDIAQKIRGCLDPGEVLQALSIPGSDLDKVPSRKRRDPRGNKPSLSEPPASPILLFRDHSQGESQQDEPSGQRPYPHLSVSHKVLMWPGVFRRIHESGISEAVTELRYFGSLGTPWLLEKDTSEYLRSLPSDLGLESIALNGRSVMFPSLTIQRVGEYCAAYFSTFNTMFPLLIMDDFKDNMGRRLAQGYANDDEESVLALLVFALGQLAIEGVFSSSTGISGGASGVARSRVFEKPSGLEIFNEARRRTGMIATQRSLLTVQIMLLQATYFEACARHADFWSSVTAASVACKYLIRGRPMEWSSMEGDLFKRAYWVCVLHERMLDIDLRISCTGIEDLEDQITLPHFHELKPRATTTFLSTPGTDAVDHDDFAYHFSALITLSRLLRRADDLIHGCERFVEENEPLWQEPSTKNREGQFVDTAYAINYKEPPRHYIEELNRQLQSWRSALPTRLQWEDTDKFDFKASTGVNGSSRTSSYSRLGTPSDNGYDIDMAVAHLRTRFYHTQFLINRPFVYKALHVPELMTAEDREKCSVAIKTACIWPLFLSPPSHTKHLVPHLFAWTQNFMAMLCILRLCQRDSFLSEICRSGGITSEEMHSSSSLMVEWLEDVRQVDGIADWSMRVLEPLL